MRLKLFFAGAVVVSVIATFIAACGNSGNTNEQADGSGEDAGTDATVSNQDGSSNDGASQADSPSIDATPLDGESDSSSASCNESDAGALDPAFGSTGVVSFPQFDGAGAYAVAFQSDGKMLIGGYVEKLFAILRLLPNGTLDATFGDGGLVASSISKRALGIAALSVQSDGRIIATGSAALGTNSDFVVVRYTPSGGMDPTFGDGGVAFAAFNSDGIPASIALLSDGHILVSGTDGDPSSDGGTDYAIARFDSNGSLDATFGTAGVATFDIRSTEDRGGEMTIQPDGKIIIVGGSTQQADANTEDVSLIRLNSNGSLDTTFGTNGKAVTNFGSGSIEASSAVIDSSGQIIVAASTTTQTEGYDMALVRFASNGTLDSMFGTASLATADFNGNNDSAGNIFLLQTGKFLVAGDTYPSGGATSIALAQFTANGALDPTFGMGGKIETSVSGFDDVSANGAALDGCTLSVASPWDPTGLGTTWIGAVRYGF